ncbi:MAG: hypothetical protein HW390_2792 [Candidatus Brocadiaceae bacterium]|nr:hypothetical protein [Candidatus Brocadiaceae bacterium]
MLLCYSPIVKINLSLVKSYLMRKDFQHFDDFALAESVYDEKKRDNNQDNPS